MIKITELRKVYHRQQVNEKVILDHINLEIKKGDMVAITGKSGAGKSTLLHIMAGISSYEEGEYLLDKRLIKNLKDREMAKIRNEKVGIVLQDFALVEEFTAIENVLLPLDFSGKTKSKAEKEKKAAGMLAYVDMAGKKNQLVGRMSGGERQRVAIARAIVNDQTLILADEPTGALDTESAGIVMKLFHQLNRAGKTIIIVTHDMDIAEQCKRKIQIRDGSITDIY